jgi:hypothetical protein
VVVSLATAADGQATVEMFEMLQMPHSSGHGVVLRRPCKPASHEKEIAPKS